MTPHPANQPSTNNTQTQTGRMEGEEQLMRQTLLIDDLQIQVTKSQVAVLQERRNYLALLAQHQQLQLREEDQARKLQAALLLGKLDERAVTHFLQKNPNAPTLTDNLIRTKEELRREKAQAPFTFTDNPILLLKRMDQLQAQLAAEKEHNAKEVFGLKTSLQLTLEERLLLHGNYEDRLKDLVKRLEEAKGQVHKLNLDNLELKKKVQGLEEEKKRRAARLGQEELTEREDGQQERRRNKGDQMSAKREEPRVQAHLVEKLTRAEIQLMEKENVIKEYELRFLQLERKVSKGREEEESAKRNCAEMVRRLKVKNEKLESRFGRLDERRKLDNAGFREDVKILRKLVEKMEKKLESFMCRKWKVESEIGEEERPQETVVKGRGRRISGKENTNKNKKTMEEVKEDKEEARGSPVEELERDKIIYDLLTNLLGTAKCHLGSLEGRLLSNRHLA